MLIISFSHTPEPQAQKRSAHKQQHHATSSILQPPQRSHSKTKVKSDLPHHHALYTQGQPHTMSSSLIPLSIDSRSYQISFPLQWSFQQWAPLLRSPWLTITKSLAEKIVNFLIWSFSWLIEKYNYKAQNKKHLTIIQGW